MSWQRFDFLLCVLLSMLLALLPALGCSKAPSLRFEVPPQPGTLHTTLSVQLTAAENKRAMVVDSADFAELLTAPLRKSLHEKGFELSGQEAQQHLVVHVTEGARGSGSVNATCKLEIYVYSSWPGPLAPRKNSAQEANGALPTRSPLLHISLDLTDQRRLRLSPTAEIYEVARYFAEKIASELDRVRASVPARIPPQLAAVPPPPKSVPKTSFDIAFRLALGPGNLTFTPAGRLFVSLHQFFDPPYSVAEVGRDGTLTEFARDAQLDSVLGIQSDENGVVWMLDNGMKRSHKPRLVGWHSVRHKLVADIELSSVAPLDAFFNDLVIDLDHEHAYLADPAGGANAALVVVDLQTKSARRVLEGHPSVVPEDLDLVVDGEPVEAARPGGAPIRPRIGINPIAADADNIWLYFGPMHGTSLYRIETAYLRDTTLSDALRAQKVERVAEKPISDGMSIDRAGNIYLGALAEHAIWKIAPGGTTEVVAQDPALAWVDAFSFAPDGKLYAVVNQLHLSAPLHRGVDSTQKPYLIIRLHTKSAGVVGR